MPRFIAFLRAINVGGRNVKMAELRALFEAIGFTNVETFIASGNIIFESESRNAKTLEQKIEHRLRESLGYEVTTFVRTDSELAAIAQYRPFPNTELNSAGTLNIAFLAAPLSAEAKQALEKLQTEIDDLHVHNREVYWLCRKKQSESGLSNAVFERVLKAKTTLRGVNTILRIAAKYPPSLRAAGA